MDTLTTIDINPKASDADVLRAGHYCVAGFAIFMAAFGSLLHGVKIDLGFIYNMTGIFTGSALPALIATFFSTRQGSLAATASIWLGLLSAVITWVSHQSTIVHGTLLTRIPS